MTLENAIKYLAARVTIRELKRQLNALKTLKHAYKSKKELNSCPLCNNECNCCKCIWYTDNTYYGYPCVNWYQEHIYAYAIGFSRERICTNTKSLNRRLHKMDEQECILRLTIEYKKKKKY